MMRVLFLAAAAMLAATAAQAQTSCADLTGIDLKDTEITTAEQVSPDPRWEYPPSLFNMLAGDAAYVEDAAFCRVAGMIEGNIGFELWLPHDWNGRFQGVGNGGFAGAINYPMMGDALARGYAVISTNTGHKSTDMFDVSWIDGHSKALVDLGHRAHHLVAERGQEMTRHYYGEAPRYAYFNGCSSGGWQGLTEAQKYPEDYDGIIAGAPAHDFVRLQADILLLAQLREADPAGNLSDAQIDALAEAAIKQCDPQDGVTDGLISDPLGCDFDPVTLHCPDGATATETCLTGAQVKRARFLYGPRETAAGLRLYPGPAFGTPLRGAAPQPPGKTGLARAVDRGPDWTYKTFNPDEDIPALEALLAEDMSAMDPDLADFAGQGGKIIVYHGWLDPGISPYHSIQYRQMVSEAYDGHVDEFYRVFLAPGMAHCRGGPGPDDFDAVTALENWVENGEAPRRIEARKIDDGDVTRSRPLCAYPEIAVYDGSGSTDAAENFTCELPEGR